VREGGGVIPDRRLGADAVSLLDQAIDDALLQLRGLALVRDLLAERGASADEVDAHSVELERVRARLVDLIRGPGPDGAHALERAA
jgi:hypothetical protein